MRILIDHSLRFTPPPGLSQAVLHLLLTPPAGPGQSIESWSVEVAGIGNAGRFADGFGNIAHLVNQSRPEGEIALRVQGVAATTDTNGVLGRPAGEPVPALYRRVTEHTKAPAEMLADLDRGQSRLDLLHGLMAGVGAALGLPEPESGQRQMQATGAQEQAQDEALEPKPAADYAHLFIAGARALDIPARFVTGYLLADEDGIGGLHEWAEAFDEGLGWIGFDARRQICPTERYVRLAVGLDAETAMPLRTVPAVKIVQAARVSAG